MKVKLMIIAESDEDITGFTAEDIKDNYQMVLNVIVGLAALRNPLDWRGDKLTVESAEILAEK